MLARNTRTIEMSLFVPAADRDVSRPAAAAMPAVALKGRDPEGVACWGDVNVMGTWHLGSLVVRLRDNGAVAELVRDIECAEREVVDFLQTADFDTLDQISIATIKVRKRIASPEMLPWLRALLHLKCSPGRSHGEHWNEEGKHEGTGRTG